MTDENLAQDLEAILTVALEPVGVDLLAEVTGSDSAIVLESLFKIRDDLENAGRGFLLVELGSGWRLQTNPSASDAVQRFAQREVSTRLSTAALETLAIVAYRQPVTRAQIASLRGVNVDGVVRLLEQRHYIEIIGQADGPGQAILYGTGDLFLDRLGLSSLDQLPKPETLLPSPQEANQLAEGIRPSLIL